MKTKNLRLQDLMIDRADLRNLTKEECDALAEERDRVYHEALSIGQCEFVDGMKKCVRDMLKNSRYLYDFFGEEFFKQFGVSQFVWDWLFDIPDDHRCPNFTNNENWYECSKFYNDLIDLCEADLLIHDGRMIMTASDEKETLLTHFIRFELLRLRCLCFVHNVVSPDEIPEDPEEE